MSIDLFAKLALQIIKEQESIIGPVALEQALKVPGLKINVSTNEISLDGEGKIILDNLVKQYETLFGRASVEVCKEAVKELISYLPPEQLPSMLR